MSPAPTQPEEPARRSPLGRSAKLLRCVLVIAAVGILSEVALRVAWRAQGDPFSTASARQRMVAAIQFGPPGVLTGLFEGPRQRAATRRARPGGAGGRHLHPYFGWDVEPSGASIERQRIQARSAGDETVEVLVLGGSLASEFATHGRAELLRVLSADPRFFGRTLRLTNHALEQFKPPQGLMRLAYLFTLGLAPDVVVHLDGLGELALGLQNARSDLHPLHPSEGAWGAWLNSNVTGDATLASFDALAALRSLQLRGQREVARCIGWRLDQSALTTALSTVWLGRSRTRGERAYERWRLAKSRDDPANDLRRGPPFRPGPEALELLIDAWVDASIAVDGICAARGVVYLRVLGPAPPMPAGATPDRTASLRNEVLGGYARLRAAKTRLADAGVAVLDAGQALALEPRARATALGCLQPEQHAELARRIGLELLERIPSDWAGAEGPVRQPFVSAGD